MLSLIVTHQLMTRSSPRVQTESRSTLKCRNARDKESMRDDTSWNLAGRSRTREETIRRSEILEKHEELARW